MNKREDALIEALHKNAEETERWKTYLKENETAKENLSIFQKSLSVEVMVPVGKKALMSGHLIHTNEVLVGHYQGYFSKCSAFKAGEICDLRIKTARDHLNKLETELEFWQNKLEKPYAEGIMPTGEEREIIEDYNEEQEEIWRKQHKLSLKLAKQKEKQKRELELANIAGKQNKKKKQKTENSDTEIMNMLEEAELMEELEQELENLDVDEITDETIRRLMAGEMKLPSQKKRVAYDKESEDKQKAETTPLATKIVKKVSLHNDRVPSTNNNVVPNPEMATETDIIDTSDDDNGEDDDLPEEVRIIKEHATFLNSEDRIGFYEYQIEIIRQKVMSLPQRSQEQIDEKIRLFNVLEHLEELLEIAETAVGNDELAEQEEKEDDIDTKEIKNNIQTIEETVEIENPKKVNQKRRISFALEDETLEFCKTEAVTQMLPEKREKPKRDVITLDDNSMEKETILTSPVVDKKYLIQAKVEQNRQFISETQSKHDFDMVHKILETSVGNVNTLHINFKHSQQLPANASTNDNKDLETPASPADFYLKYLDKSKGAEPCTLFINSYDGEDQVKTPVLKEVDKQQAFEDPKAVFSNPKSILRNKLAIEKENHYPDAQIEGNGKKQKKKKRTPKEEEESISAYNMVMNEVVEKPASEPEPLPEGKFIDAHTPKRRVSRFKQMRQGTEKT